MASLPVARMVPIQIRTLAGLIEMYEGNYQRLTRLAPELDSMEGTTVSRVAGALDLYLTVMERYRYTTLISLTYQFPDPDGWAAEPNTRVCVYHDARAVDVLTHTRRRRTPGRRRERRPQRAELNRKWELNRFLNKWLGFCLRQGHMFLRCTTVRVETPPAVRNGVIPAFLLDEYL